jgi:sulfur carrier protein
MTILLNGKSKDVADNVTLKELIGSLDLEEANTVAEVSGEIISPERYATVVLKEQDTVELIRFVGGG